MRRERRIRPGQDWIYSTGGKKSSVLYNVQAISQLQAERTIAISRLEDEHRQGEAQANRLAIETYDSPNSITPTEAQS